METTDKAEYALRLQSHQDAWWKRLFNVQLPYRWCLRSLRPRFTLEIGCGIGRYLSHLNGNAVGVDHNELAVSMAQSKGFEAYTPAEFTSLYSGTKSQFDTLLFGHILEHLTENDAKALIDEYRPWLKPAGKVISITPGPKGFKSDPTHVTFFNKERAKRLLIDSGFTIDRAFCFPFPEVMGRYFKHNEYVIVATLKKPNE